MKAIHNQTITSIFDIMSSKYIENERELRNKLKISNSDIAEGLGITTESLGSSSKRKEYFRTLIWIANRAKDDQLPPPWKPAVEPTVEI